MLDLHTHILANVDDGSKSIEESLEMIRLEIEENDVDKIILTPHYFSNDLGSKNIDVIQEKFNELKELTKDLNVKLYLGYEVYYSNHVLEELKQHKNITLNNSNYLLLEFSIFNTYYDVVDVAYNVSCIGYKPIIAHPERYLYLSLKKINELKNIGCKIQINTSSILGDFGNSIRKRAIKMIKLGLVDYIASDCHSLDVRKPNLKHTLSFIEKKYKIKFNNEVDFLDD